MNTFYMFLEAVTYSIHNSYISETVAVGELNKLYDEFYSAGFKTFGQMGTWLVKHREQIERLYSILKADYERHAAEMDEWLGEEE